MIIEPNKFINSVWIQIDAKVKVFPCFVTCVINEISMKNYKRAFVLAPPEAKDETSPKQVICILKPKYVSYWKRALLVPIFEVHSLTILDKNGGKFPMWQIGENFILNVRIYTYDVLNELQGKYGVPNIQWTLKEGTSQKKFWW